MSYAMSSGMRLLLISLTAAMVFSSGLPLLKTSAHATKLSGSGAESTIQTNCNLCSNLSITETPQPSMRQPHRPHHPRNSRPHRLPRGGYKLRPGHKSVQLSSRAGLARARLARQQPIYTIDGDTLRMGSERIRLRGIDTPELNEPGGQAARQRLEQLLKEGPIRIVPHGQDVYGRTVADVFAGGRNVASVLAEEGYAKPRL